ncbi:MAG: GTP-binding protein, partial [Candidatus Electrothrix sp. AR4]|nr:GTP-binding protein [Candidatus Electrothrix sp. AR4]
MTNEKLLKIITEKAKASEETVLNLRKKKLSTLPLEVFQMESLKILYLSHNKLTFLPPEIAQLTNLTRLNLRDNQLTFLPKEIGQLTNLQYLHIGLNQLTLLPPEICQLSNLKELYLDDNPLSSPPPEIAKQGIDAIREYFVALQKEEHPLNEVKIILIGEGAAGKTSLTKVLLDQPFDSRESTTHGIRISPWEPNTDSQPLKVNIWDFGGQDIMHATHQFFLSKRSLYVLVLDGRRDEEAEYWLRHVSSFGGDSPVLIVLNKQDENPGFDLNRPFLRRKYPSIKGFFPTSCENREGIDEFREVLVRELVQMPMLETRWPMSWFRVKERLEEMKEPYISCDHYEEFCTAVGIT